MAQWFYQDRDTVRGPISGKQLLELVKAGKIRHDTPVRKDDSHWVPASSVGGLFERAHKEGRHENICPYCGHEVGPPPTTCAGCGHRITFSILAKTREAGDRRQIELAPPQQTAAPKPRRLTLRNISLVVIALVWLALMIGGPYVTNWLLSGNAVFLSTSAVVVAIGTTAVLGLLVLLILRAW